MTQQHNLQTLIDSAPAGKTQWRVITYCFLVIVLDGFDATAIGFITPDIRTRWQLTVGDLAPLFSTGLLRLTAGTLLCSPLSDRFDRKRVIELYMALFGVLSLVLVFSPDLQMPAILRFLTGLGLGGAVSNTITITSGYLLARRRGALVTMMFRRFTLGSAMGGIIGAQLVPVTGQHGILVLGGVLPPMLFVALLLALPESPRRQVCRQLPQNVIARTISVIAREHYGNTHFHLNKGTTITKGSIRQLSVGRQLPITLMLWIVFFMSLLIVYLLSSWIPALSNRRGIDLQHASWVTAAFQIGSTLDALVLSVLMDKYNPFRMLAVDYTSDAVYIVMIGLSENGLRLTAPATFGTGIGISGSQVSLNVLTATFYPAQNRAMGVSWSNAVGRCGAIVGSPSGGVMMAMNLSFDNPLFVIAVPVATSAMMLTLPTVVVRQSTSASNTLPRAGVVNGQGESLCPN